MGAGRDKRKKHAKKLGKTTAAPSGAAKTEHKRERTLEKNQRRLTRELAGDDIDAILAALALANRERDEVSIEKDCPKPSARACATMVCVQRGGKHELVVYGGERAEGDACFVSNDAYVYDCDRNKWSKVTCANAPHPRSGHQALAHRTHVYVFGGEFTSPNQERFLHYRDAWRFDTENNVWEQMPTKNGPSARSGHRMAVHGKRAIMFGGFYDTGNAEVKYFNDVWEFNLETHEWKCRCVGGEGAIGPSPRSACHVAVIDDEFILYGGYCKNVEVGEKAEDINERGMTFDDTWKLDLKTWRWERLKKLGLAPSARAGAVSALHALKKRMVLFGGVVDHEIKRGDVIVSEFFTDAYNLNLEAKKWFPVTLYGDDKTKTHKAGSVEEAERVARGEVVNENFNIRSELVRAAIKIQSHYRGYVVRKAYKLYKVGGVVSELLYSPGSGEAPPKSLPRPRGRINAAIAIQGNILYMFGGVIELGDVEVALDDLWKLDLGNRPKWTCIDPLSESCARQLAGEGASSSDDDDEDDSDSDSDSD